MEKAWISSYSEGVPSQVNLDNYRSLTDMFLESFKKYADRDAFACMGKVLNYKEIDEMSAQFAAYLQKVVGLKKGDRIAIQLPNILQYPIVLFGALRAGLIVVNTNPLYTEREMEHQFNDSGAKALVVLSNFADKVERVLPKTSIETVIVTQIGDLLDFPKRQLVNFVVKSVKKMVPKYNLPKSVAFRDVLSWGAAHSFDDVEVNPEDIAFLQYTGGTTGVSKGVMLLHKNMLANMEQMAVIFEATHKISQNPGVIVTALPLYHIFSLTVNCFAFTRFGCMNLLIPNPRDVKAFVGELSRYPFAYFTGVNTLFNLLANNAEFKKLDFSHLKLCVAGGMALQKYVSELWKEVTGCNIVEGYGLTESSPVLTVNPLDGRERIGTIGLPLPSTDIKIIDEEGNEVPFGESGELIATGPQIMAGYWQRPEETKQTMTEDGWLKTGDVACAVEDGFFKIVDRIKDMILVSGFNVYPNEIEDIACLHDKVLEAAAVGVEDERSGEAVKLFVVAQDDSLTVDELRKHCKENLTGYKVPKHIEFRKELPKTNVGKILRRALRDEKAASTATKTTQAELRA